MKYGKPECSRPRIGKYLKGDDYVKKGVVVLVDDEVKIQNMYSAMEKSTVRCTYNFETKKVDELSINGEMIQ